MVEIAAFLAWINWSPIFAAQNASWFARRVFFASARERFKNCFSFQLLRLPWTVPVSLRNGSQNWSEAVHVIAHLALITQEHSVGELLGLADLTTSLSDGALPGDRGIEALDGEHELRECVRFLDIGTPDLNHLPIVSIFLLLFFVVFLLLKENIFGFGGRCFFFTFSLVSSNSISSSSSPFSLSGSFFSKPKILATG